MMVSVGRPDHPGGERVRTLTDHRLATGAVVTGRAARHAVAVGDTRLVATSLPGLVCPVTRPGAGLMDPAA